MELLTALQQSKTLDKSLETLSVVLPRLAPIDWAAMLLLTPDGHMQLARAYSDGEPDDFAERAFKLEGTLLEECLHNGSPLHIPNVLDTARFDRRYRFLSLLGKRGRHDAVFMPILDNDPKVGVLVLASRHPTAIGRSMCGTGICQDRSRLFDHAARHFSSLLRSGFNATGPTGSQFRVWPDHRAGLAAFACS